MDYKDVAITAAKEAGSILMRYYKSDNKIKLKGDVYDVSTIVTEADVQSEQKIISVLKESFPDFGIYGEESSGSNMDSDYIWYVDPLDGTSNFTRHIPLFGVSIGLIFKGQPIVGVLYFPALDLLLAAENGKGCFANGQPVRVSQRLMAESLYYAGGKFRGRQQLEPAISQGCGLVKIIDASSYEFAQIAMGDAEIYYLVNVPHDVVAGVCIVREAGGIVTDGHGDQWQLGSKMILAANKSCHEKILKLLDDKK